MPRTRDRASAAGLLPHMEARPRKNGVTYRYHPVGGKPINLGHDLTEAIKQVMQMLGRTGDEGTLRGLWARYRGINCPPSSKWLALSERTQRDYDAYSVALLRVMGNAPIVAIRPHYIMRYLQVERADAPVRANHEISLLSILLTMAVEQGDLNSNPCKQIGRKNKERPRTTIPETTELEAFAQWMQAQGGQRQVIGMMAEFIALTGNRRVEFMRLERDAIDLAAGVICTQRVKLHDGRVKAEEIIIGPALHGLLERILALPCPEGSSHLFLTRDGNPYSDSAFQSTWQRAIVKARIEGVISSRFTFHDLRAYYATRHKAQYGDLPEMHARRATTDAVYDRSKRPARRSVD